MRYDLPLPDVRKRSKLYREPRNGDVVAFLMQNFGGDRTGVMVMQDSQNFLVASNFSDENEDGIWVYGFLTDDITLFEASDEEKEWGHRYFYELNYLNPFFESDKIPIIQFIDDYAREYTEDRIDWYDWGLCADVMTSLLYHSELSDDTELINKVWGTALEEINAGLCYNQNKAELYCFLIGILMIKKGVNNEHDRKHYAKMLKTSWNHFSWMYAMVVGRIIGCRYKNFLSMVNGLDNCCRRAYIHLYIPLIESNVEKVCKFYETDTPYKLRAAIKKIKLIEERYEQSDDLDELWKILFPKHFQVMVRAISPAASIKEMKHELAIKEKEIQFWKGTAEDLTDKLDVLTSRMKKMVEETLSLEDVSMAILDMKVETAKMVFFSLDYKLRKNTVWLNGREGLLDKLEEKEKREDILIAIRETPRINNFYSPVGQVIGNVEHTHGHVN